MCSSKLWFSFNDWPTRAKLAPRGVEVFLACELKNQGDYLQFAGLSLQNRPSEKMPMSSKFSESHCCLERLRNYKLKTGLPMKFANPAFCIVR